MRRAVLTVMSTVAGLVMLLGFKTVPLSTDAAASGSSDVTASGTSEAPSSAAPETVAGQAYGTRYGDVQVTITVVDGELTDITPVTLPSANPRDVQINAAATPVLEQEALSAQSADVDMVSGATYTSQGYLQSLQSALDQVPALTQGQG